MKIIPPKHDECIKEIFRNKVVLKHFISDILGIPVEEIRSVRLINTFLWRKYRGQKLGILDVLAELDGEAKVNIEIQLKIVAYWDRRQIFYLSKLFTENLLSGEDYSLLKRCVGISILDFNLTDSKEYHNTYYLMNRKGELFSDVFEIHTLELGKKLEGNRVVDDWIRLFNAESEEDLGMIKTKNKGILEAIREVREINLRGRLRMRYEAHVKAARDQRAQESYAREIAIKEGLEQGIEQGIAQGLEQGLEQGVERGIAQGIEQGQARVNLLYKLLIENSRSEEIERAVTDTEYQKKLFEEFRI